MSSKAVATRDENTELAIPMESLWGGDDQITAQDVKSPEIRITQSNSEAAKEGYARNGSVIFTYGSEDPNPAILIGPEKHDPDEFVVYVLCRDKFAATTAGGGLTFHEQPVRDMDDPKSWEGWHIYVASPEHDQILPARMMLWKSNAPAARAINGFIQRAKQRGDYDPIPVRFTITEKSNDKGSWYVYRVAQIAKDEVPAEDLAIAEAQRPLALEMIANRAHYRNQGSGSSDQPEV